MLRLVLGTALVAALAACGKKGPPKRPDGSFGVKIERDTDKKRQ
jgi:predicted small lipoprotein YifL